MTTTRTFAASCDEPPLTAAPAKAGRMTLRTLSACVTALCLVAAPSLASAQEATRGYAAYTVYTYNGGPQGMAGRIRDTGAEVKAVPGLRTGLNGDPQVEGVIPSEGALRIAVTNRVAEPGAVAPTYIYNATAVRNPAPLASPSWPDVRNMYGIAKVGRYLYAIDYDNARVVEINRNSFEQTGVSYTLPAEFVPQGFKASGQAIVEIEGQLFGLFTFVDSTFSAYARSLLVRFTIKGGVSITVGPNDYNAKLVKNAFSLAVSGSDIYVAGIGGPQTGGSYNKASRLQKIAFGAKNLRKAPITNVFKPSRENPYEVRDISFKGKLAYMLLGAYDGNFQMQGKLVRTRDFATLRTINDFSAGAPGYFWGAQYTPDNDRLWFIRGNEILAYDAATPRRPVETLTLTAGSLISAGDAYDSLGDFAHVGAKGSVTSVRGYRSPVQVSDSPRARAARALAKGRPELSEDERSKVDEELSRPDASQ